MINVIADRTRGIIAEHLGQPIEKVIESADLIIDLGADSLDTVELTMIFESEFGLSITDNDAEAMDTVGNAITTLELLNQQQNPTSKGN